MLLAHARRVRWSLRIAAILLLSIGLGVAAAVIAALHAFVVRPLPFSGARSIVEVHRSKSESGPLIVSDEQFDRLYKDMALPLGAVAGFSTSGVNSPGLFAGPAERLRTCAIAGDFFRVLGVEPKLGRSFFPEELDTAAPVAVITESVWQRLFGRSAAVIGATLQSERGVYVVVGVLDQRFVFPAGTEAWVPRVPYAGPGRQMALQVLGRLREGWSIEQASAAISSAMVEDTRPTPSPAVRLVRLADLLLQGAQRPVIGAALLAALLLTAVWVNLVQLSVTQGLRQRREYAIRLSLGATVSSLRQLALREAVLTSLPGVLLACVVASWVCRVLASVAPPSYYYRAQPQGEELFSIGICLLSFVGAVPFQAFATGRTLLRPDSWADLRILDALHDRHKEWSRSRLALAVQVSLTVTLLTVGLSLWTSYTKVSSVDLGYQPDDLVSFRVSLPLSQYGSPPLRAAAFAALLDRLRNVPSVSAAEATATSLLSHPGASVAPMTPADRLPFQRWVTVGFLPTIGAQLLEGRGLEERDERREVAVVNEAYVRTYVTGPSALGRSIQFSPPREVVGIVADVRDADVAVRQPPVAYLPMRGFNRSAEVVLRVGQGRRIDVQTVRRAVSSVSAEISVEDFQTMAERLRQATQPWRARALLVAIAAAAASVVLAVGLVATLWERVERERHAIAVRVALGAMVHDISAHLRRVLMFPIVAGALAGATCGWAFEIVFASQFYGVRVGDGAHALLVVLISAGVALSLPSFVAWRCTRTPVQYLLKDSR